MKFGRSVVFGFVLEERTGINFNSFTVAAKMSIMSKLLLPKGSEIRHGWSVSSVIAG
jgi:hypothetical protein